MILKQLDSFPFWSSPTNRIVRNPRILKRILHSSKFCLPLLITSFAHAASQLPYTTRTHGYSAYNNTVQGDLNVLGMAGATLGLVTSFNSSSSNPAGLAMTLNGVSLEITGNTIYDGRMQSYDDGINTLHYGLAANLYPWGVSFGYWTPQSEGQVYLLNPSLSPSMIKVETHEFRFSLARVFLEDKLSVGLGLVLGHHSQEMDLGMPSVASQSIDAFSTTFGAMYQLPHRWILGASYDPGIQYKVGHGNGTDPSLPGFYQEAHAPPRVGIGLGWIPNRYFSYGFSLYWIGISQNSALLRDDNLAIGYQQVLQPRMGASYTIAEYKELKLQAIAGTYFEFSRTQGIPDRLHGTVSLKVDPWIFQIGWGVDAADKYRNFIYSFGVDLMKTMRKLDLVPKEKRRDYPGFGPRLDEYNDAGLSRALVENWNPKEREEDLVEIGLQLPEKISNKIEQTKEDIGKVFGAEEETPKKKKHRRRKPMPPPPSVPKPPPPVKAKSAKAAKTTTPKSKPKPAKPKKKASTPKKPAAKKAKPAKKKKPKPETDE